MTYPPMQINPEWLQDDGLQSVLETLFFGPYGASFLVGGCVRDAVAGLPCADIDIATPHSPEKVTWLFGGREDVKLLPTGVDHGTLTAMIGGVGYEVTTFRKDFATDGRRATVEFAKTIQEDAMRRDFTMNALYMDHQGWVFDPTGEGIDDLLARRVRFVGSADERCKEDYLRILRLFRFHAKYGKGPMDSSAFWAASDNKAGLSQVSGERIWAELKKLLSCHDPMDALFEMERSGVLGFILPRHSQVQHVADVISIERQASAGPGWERRLVALMGYDEDDVQMPFPVSNAEQKYLTLLAQNWDNGGRAAQVAYKTQDTRSAYDCYVLALAADRDIWSDPTKEIMRGRKACMPLTASYLMQSGLKGKALGDTLRTAEKVFIRSDLLAELDSLLDVFEVRVALSTAQRIT